MALQARPLRTYTEERDGKTYTVNVYPDYTPEQGRVDLLDEELNERDGTMWDWSLAARFDLSEVGVPMRSLGDENWDEHLDPRDPFEAIIVGADVRDDHDAVGKFIDRWGDTAERRAFLEALSAGHQISEACRLSGLSVDRARHFLDALRRGELKRAA